MYRGSQVRIEDTLGGEHDRQPRHRTPNRGWHSSWTDTRGGPVKVLLRRLGEQTRGGRTKTVNLIHPGGIRAWYWVETVPDLPWELHSRGACLPQVQVDPGAFAP